MLLIAKKKTDTGRTTENAAKLHYLHISTMVVVARITVTQNQQLLRDHKINSKNSMILGAKASLIQVTTMMSIKQKQKMKVLV
ncbi:hypothetical protein MAR_002683 [Mya arenaria]|uniref:Uncharacterized protein n=1 Tax=Mya arenaria TaxID=6604 RepID=A0ABY7G4N2_MYAAR|nr:hypothetical protein MAR_002683 [Mya arenaria]